MPADTAGEVCLRLEREGLQRLIDRLAADGYAVIGPRAGNGAITLGPVSSVADLPLGLTDEQEAGHYRLVEGGDGAFAHASPAQPWKRHLYPAQEQLWKARSDGGSFTFEPQPAPERFALLGMRACDLAALQILDTVLGATGAREARYMARRERSFVIAVNCTRAAATCFCVSMGTGPRVGKGFDIALTELAAPGGDAASARYIARAGSERGAQALRAVGADPADSGELSAEGEAVARAETQQRRSMVPDVADLLQRNLESRQWSQVAERCLGCANCTMVCPTCFCATVEDVTDLSGEIAERWRKWDSCFTADFTYIHGGSIRRSGASRYRQWITHKLSGWWQQFETSGCVGCGRCITWCPVAIDITEEARNLRDSEGGAER